MSVVRYLYDVSSVTSVTRALPPWQLANDFALEVVARAEYTVVTAMMDADLLMLMRLVQTLPGGDQWLDHGGRFTEEDLPLITRIASHRLSHALVELVRRRRVWKRRRTVWLLRALRDNHRARPRSLMGAQQRKVVMISRSSKRCRRRATK